MNKNNAIAILLALVVLALLGSGAAGYMYFSHELNLTAYRAQAAEMHTQELEKQVAELTETARIADERGREISTLRNQSAELEKQIAELKTKSVNAMGGVPTFTIPHGNFVWQANEQPIVPQQIFLGGLDAQVQHVQVEEAVKTLRLGFADPGQVQAAEVIKLLDGGIQVQNLNDNFTVHLAQPAAPPAAVPGETRIMTTLPAAGGAGVKVEAPAEITRRTRLTRRLVETEKLQNTPQLQQQVQVQLERLVDETKPANPAVKPPKNEPTTEQF